MVGHDDLGGPFQANDSMILINFPNYVIEMLRWDQMKIFHSTLHSGVCLSFIISALVIA